MNNGPESICECGRGKKHTKQSCYVLCISCVVRVFTIINVPSNIFYARARTQGALKNLKQPHNTHTKSGPLGILNSMTCTLLSCRTQRDAAPRLTKCPLYARRRLLLQACEGCVCALRRAREKKSMKAIKQRTTACLSAVFKTLCRTSSNAVYDSRVCALRDFIIVLFKSYHIVL